MNILKQLAATKVVGLVVRYAAERKRKGKMFSTSLVWARRSRSMSGSLLSAITVPRGEHAASSGLENFWKNMKRAD